MGAVGDFPTTAVVDAFFAHLSRPNPEASIGIDALGVTPAEVAGIGDTVGDLPLAESVGFFACPANAVQAVKARAAYVSPHPTLDGVLDILTRPECRRA